MMNWTNVIRPGPSAIRPLFAPARSERPNHTGDASPTPGALPHGVTVRRPSGGVTSPRAPHQVAGVRWRVPTSPVGAPGGTTALAGPQRLMSVLVPPVVPLVSANEADERLHGASPPTTRRYLPNNRLDTCLNDALEKHRLVQLSMVVGGTGMLVLVLTSLHLGPMPTANFTGNPASDNTDTKGVPQLPRHPLIRLRQGTRARARRNSRHTLAASISVPAAVVKTSPVSCPQNRSSPPRRGVAATSSLSTSTQRRGAP
jgi:hypothetical protein